MEQVGLRGLDLPGSSEEAEHGGFSFAWREGGASRSLQRLPDFSVFGVWRSFGEAHAVDSFDGLAGSEAQLGLDPESLFHLLPNYYIDPPAIQN